MMYCRWWQMISEEEKDGRYFVCTYHVYVYVGVIVISRRNGV